MTPEGCVRHPGVRSVPRPILPPVAHRRHASRARRRDPVSARFPAGRSTGRPARGATAPARHRAADAHRSHPPRPGFRARCGARTGPRPGANRPLTRSRRAASEVRPVRGPRGEGPVPGRAPPARSCSWRASRARSRRAARPRPPLRDCRRARDGCGPLQGPRRVAPPRSSRRPRQGRPARRADLETGRDGGPRPVRTATSIALRSWPTWAKFLGHAIAVGRIAHPVMRHPATPSASSCPAPDASVASAGRPSSGGNAAWSPTSG